MKSKERKKKSYLKGKSNHRKEKCKENHRKNSSKKKKHIAVTAKERESEEEREKKGSLKTRHKKLKISRKPKRHTWGINSTSQDTTRDHDVYSTATTH